MTTTDAAALERACLDAVSTALDIYRPRLLTAALERQRQERDNLRHRDNFLSGFDLTLHDHYKRVLADQLPGFTYLSEEADPEPIGTPGDLVILVDPLDTSELAVRGLNGYTHLLAYSTATARPLVAVVGDFFHHIDLYYATRGTDGSPAAWLRTRDGTIHPVTAPTAVAENRLLVTNYLMRPAERLGPLTRQHRLLELLTHGPDHRDAGAGPAGDRSRLGVDFGSIGLCHVATGATDAFVELAKGFALWDLLPGQYILEAAGGAVYDLDGQPLPWPTRAFTDTDAMHTAMSTRQTFIAAPTPTIATTLAAAIDI